MLKMKGRYFGGIIPPYKSKQNGAYLIWIKNCLAFELLVSRQTVSKWETESALPDLDVLLRLSKLYKITVNEILEPVIKKPYLADFEEVPTVEHSRLIEVLSRLEKEEIAAMGASPQVNGF